jgi:hypothetical protein
MNLLCSTGFNAWSTRTGYLLSSPFGRVGRFSNPPPQLGQTFSRTFSTHCAQNVHSKVQIMASFESFGKLLPQFSQHGLISSIYFQISRLSDSFLLFLLFLYQKLKSPPLYHQVVQPILLLLSKQNSFPHLKNYHKNRYSWPLIPAL